MPTPSSKRCRVRKPQADKVDNLIARRAARQFGVLSLAELTACGLNRTAVAVRVRNGRLHPIHRGVYAVGHRNIPLYGRFLAAVKACGPYAVLSHYSAAVLWGLVNWDGRRIEVTVPGTAARLQPTLRTHRTTHPERTSKHGIPVTPPARTLVDLASVLAFKPLRRAVRQAQSLRLVTTTELVKTRSTLLRQIVATGPAPTRTDLEDLVLDLILSGGFRHPDVNAPLQLATTVVPDFRWPAQHLVVEADSTTWHDHPLARADDAERQALLEAHGERVIRITWHQALQQPGQTLARLRQAGAPRAEATMSGAR